MFELSSNEPPPQLSGFICTYQSVVLGSNPKHTIYSFIDKFCAVFVFALRKRTKVNKKRPGLGHYGNFIFPTYNMTRSAANFFASRSYAVWPDWAIYWNLGNFLKLLATINLSKSPTFLGNFCKGVKIYQSSSEIIFRQLWHLAIFFWSHWWQHSSNSLVHSHGVVYYKEMKDSVGPSGKL